MIINADSFSAGNIAWVLTSAALVLMMTPALGFFYGGMVRKKNVLSTISLSFVTIATVSFVWILWGYSLSFGPDAYGGFIGNLKYIGLFNMKINQHSRYANTLPSYVFVVFQLMFAIITVALISGSLVERVKFSTWVVFTVIWLTVVYAPIAQWVWGKGGFLAKMGALDFAGGTVVHISAGFAGLAGALALGKRNKYLTENIIQPNQLGYTILGAGLLWFGWFGFNGGSALAANSIAASAILATNTAAASAAISWMIAEWVRNGKPTSLGIVSGAIAGLATITPAAGYVTPWAAMIIGLIAGIICFSMVIFIKPKLGYDDALDVFSVHGVGSVWGVFATGLFADPLINKVGRGLFYGNPRQLLVQVITIIIVATYSFALSFIIFKVLDLIMGLRVDKDSETMGLDITQHEETGYNL
ncbi:MAG: ammonium transporter [Candidatus Acidulodesulfobacterium acidiphilum]|uniref:Ammonium transporter n=1 Tax=Candidatus Acidulodesulfobacterium acidiphilum TaxID=2597224 RepID=A0A520X7I3_9DELT|nr:MAG: ammonium transporter [Candidatus Acidulodesulfobacterium acidiphilum]